jgi:hypothetical protein
MTAEEKKYRILGIILAAVTYAVIIVAMILTRISASSEQNSQINASENKTQIAFDGEEYVEFGDIPEPNLNDGEPAANDADNEPASDGSDQTNEGNPGDGEALVSSRHNSPMETPKKKKTGPTTAELNRRASRKKRNNRRKKRIKSTTVRRTHSTAPAATEPDTAARPTETPRQAQCRVCPDTTSAQTTASTRSTSHAPRAANCNSA